MLLLALAVWLVDIKGKARWLGFFNVFGKNPLIAYLISELAVVTLNLIHVPAGEGQSQTAFEWLYAHTGAAIAGDNGFGSFLFSVGYMLGCWVVSWFCFRRGILLKV